MTVKSTMQYLVLGLALAGVPLLAEADESSTTRLTTPVGAFPDAMESLDEHREWQLLNVEQQGEHTLLHLQTATGQRLTVPTLEGAAELEGRQIHYHLSERAALAGQEVWVLGGEAQAVDIRPIKQKTRTL